MQGTSSPVHSDSTHTPAMEVTVQLVVGSGGQRGSAAPSSAAPSCVDIKQFSVQPSAPSVAPTQHKELVSAVNQYNQSRQQQQQVFLDLTNPRCPGLYRFLYIQATPEKDASKQADNFGNCQ